MRRTKSQSSQNGIRIKRSSLVATQTIATHEENQFNPHAIQSAELIVNANGLARRRDGPIGRADC